MNKEELIKLADDLEKRVDDYANKLLTDEIKSCKKMKWACQRYFNFKNKYKFDKIELLKVYVWASQFKHRAGVLKGKNIELHDSLLFDMANIFCFKKENGKRLTRKVYEQKARKNVKTQSLALISSYVAANNEGEQQEIYIAG